MSGNKRAALPPHLHMFPVTFAFFAAGAIFFLAVVLFLPWNIPSLVKTQALHSPGGIWLAHILVLGWATMIAMGASYQIAQVILRCPVYSHKLAFVHLFL
ncbi:hypothetical protein [Gordoniibacillus kamchatkensis]|nr:hypothetical protein [Paenibacillus sp. VKM B-2647]